MGILDADAYPLYWPEQWPRTPPNARESTTRYKITFSDARDRVVRELKLLGATEVVLSTNIPLRRDGLPRMDVSEPADAGVALYWVEWKLAKSREQIPRVIACDHWRKVRDNMRAGMSQSANAIKLSERAAAVLQGFPEHWQFIGKTKRARWSQIGQAMPPPLAHAVAVSIAAWFQDGASEVPGMRGVRVLPSIEPLDVEQSAVAEVLL